MTRIALAACGIGVAVAIAASSSALAQVATAISIDRAGSAFSGVIEAADERCAAGRNVELVYRRQAGGSAAKLRAGAARADGTWSLRRFPTTLTLDGFDRADGPVGSDWASLYGPSFTIKASELAATGEWSAMRWGSPVEAPHEVFVTLAQEPVIDNHYMYLTLLDNPDRDEANGYAVEFDDDYWDLFRIDEGRWRRLEAWYPFIHDSEFFRNGDRIGIGFDGADVVMYRTRDGVTTVLGRAMDSTHRPELMYPAIESSDQGYVRLDDFGGGGAAGIPLGPGAYFARTPRTVVAGSEPVICDWARSSRVVVKRRR
jgi:hypothetical protein